MKIETINIDFVNTSIADLQSAVKGIITSVNNRIKASGSRESASNNVINRWYIG